MITREQIVAGVKKRTLWWIKERQKKLIKQLHDTMSVNPFLLPFLFNFHDLDEFGDLANIMISAHLLTGHNTGFGKLIDEKILPEVFGCAKLSKAYRAENPPLSNSCFDEVDHIVTHGDGSQSLLSLKAGKWTIQLTMAVQLNRAFDEILTNFGDKYKSIVVGVFYGKTSGLTDKYDILRGINRGANHDVKDLTNNVNVFAGREFWEWLAEGIPDAQHAVLEGMIAALKESNLRDVNAKLLDNFKKGVVSQYSEFDETEEIDWHGLLKSING